MLSVKPPPRAAQQVPRPVVILFSVGNAITQECLAAAKQAELSVSEVKHLQAACSVLKTTQAAMLVASSSIKPWDRLIVEEHAERAAIPVRFVSESDVVSVGDDVLAWATEAARSARRR